MTSAKYDSVRSREISLVSGSPHVEWFCRAVKPAPARPHLLRRSEAKWKHRENIRIAVRKVFGSD